MNVTHLSRVTSRRMSRDGHAMSTTPHHTHIVTSVFHRVGNAAYPTYERRREVMR